MSSTEHRMNQHLAMLLQLEQQARAAPNLQHLAFVMVNETRALLEYRQAILWRCDTHSVQAFSGLALVEAQAPMHVWLTRQCKRWQADPQGSALRHLRKTDVPEEEQPHWNGYLADELLWLPLQRPGGPLLGALLLSRDCALQSGEQSLLKLWLDACSHAWANLIGPSRAKGRKPLNRRKGWLAGAALLLVLLVPVRQSVLAPAEIIPRDPAVLRAPLQGVVERILVQPNQTVVAGTPLIELDGREVQSRLESARQAFAVAEAEFRQAQQQALFDQRSKATLSVLQGQREQARADVDFLQANLERMRIQAPRSGVAIFDDPSDWIGRPVAMGERIMLIAAPQEADLEVQLPISDAIALQSGAETQLFLNTDPSAPLAATLQRIGYRASPNAEGNMTYRLKASFDGQDPRIRVGLKGTAKLYGDRTVLFYYLMRRPLAALRIHLGW
ncbi:efflux RND transporter periplasmic adaptor subunit [Pseudomonas sp. FW300-N2F2]|uniref:efflux RND transporter periplasmic adaptor subunit n=1 Tax=Pseudomonas sp. FW300-N2F2 TaxID=2751320 RepID=UPI001A92611A|nr:HlyD family efflux transporter periplasmic adaptor subunit [Pseudomonas sp. FW300-N2F2]